LTRQDPAICTRFAGRTRTSGDPNAKISDPVLDQSQTAFAPNRNAHLRAAR
jgi:hypothetical protein